MMAGLYFHIPFCKSLCAYCDFFRSVRLADVQRVVEAMHQELREQRFFLPQTDFQTIYFGGGTPSILAPSELQRFIDAADNLYGVGDVGEITVEVNPDDITAEYVERLRNTAINRVSMGVQSFNDSELRFMNRRHSAADAVDAVRRLQDAGISNITIDLIFGVDGFDEDVLGSSLEQTLSLGVQHVSAYHLTIEPSTTFHRRLLRGEMREVAESQSEKEFMLIHNALTSAGFEHYEVSNYALPGVRARHNASYWHGVHYLGIGPGAHSFNGRERHWTLQEFDDYCRERCYQSELLDGRDCFNEYVMTRLRCAEGLDLEYVEQNFGKGLKVNLEKCAESWVVSGDLVVEGKNMRIPAERFLISDAVIESLFEA